ncbi:MAG: amidase [Phyllobacteriaceae bacterium]|jgi:Asp-tRNA(Asn)/Glu-tRNA(Gln) amidotransferase A subunit family amidase|nr:amidase [Phyllobacteriaceae bacterium]
MTIVPPQALPLLETDGPDRSVPVSNMVDPLPDPVVLVETCLANIRKTDADIRAWRVVFEAEAIAHAEACAADIKTGLRLGGLQGVPVGVKDIIDMAGHRTLCGSKARIGRPPETADAWIVRALKTAGAIPLGKTHTTEFACFDPALTANPRSLGHTPGGSSSGSAAAVAAGHVPFAIGTQTVASVNRPAAYCGVTAFKPTPGLWPMDGVVPFAPSFDTLGLFAGSVEVVARGVEALSGDRLAMLTNALDHATVHVIDDALLDNLEPDDARYFDDFLRQLEDNGISIKRGASPIDMGRLNALQSDLVAYEAARSHARTFDEEAALLGPKLTELLSQGAQIGDDACLAMRRDCKSLCNAFRQHVPKDAIFLWPATPAPAPLGLEWTGDPRLIQPWTVLGGPILSVPNPACDDVLPRGLLFSSSPFSDRSLLTFGRSVIAPVCDRAFS